MEFEEFVGRAIEETGTAPAEMRSGQVIFNLLVKLRPDLAKEVRGSAMDPFYVEDTEPLTFFWSWLEHAWG
jgi:hypothetical protein